MYSVKLGILFCLLSLSGWTQPVQKGFELLEIMKIAEVYRQAPHLSFTFQYTYSDSSNANEIIEQTNGSSKISEGKYWTQLGAVEFMQGYQYSLTIYSEDSVIAVSDKQEFGKVMQLPFMDSLFREANITDMEVQSVNDSTNVLLVHFGSHASYSQYKLYYHSRKYLISKIEYYTKDLAADASEGLSGTALIRMTLTNYNDSPINQESFKEDKYVYKLNGAFFLKPAYSGYRLLLNTSN